MEAMNDKCRSVDCSFFYSLTTGVFSQVFCDFGERSVVSDVDGEQPHASQVEMITCDNPTTVKVLEYHGRHGLETGDYVTFSKLKGLEGGESQGENVNVGLDPNKEYEIKSTGPYTFELVNVDLSTFTMPATQGYITQVKKPVTLSFQSYKEALDHPKELMMSDFAKFDRPPMLHLLYKGLHTYMQSHDGKLPNVGSQEDAAELVSICKSLDSTAAEDDKIITEENEAKITGLIEQFASGSQAILSPMCAAMGGIVGQEVLKACSGKFTPISGFFHFDASETLPEGGLLPIQEVTPEVATSRYTSQISVFGKTLQDSSHCHHDGTSYWTCMFGIVQDCRNST